MCCIRDINRKDWSMLLYSILYDVALRLEKNKLIGVWLSCRPDWFNDLCNLEKVAARNHIFEKNHGFFIWKK